MTAQEGGKKTPAFGTVVETEGVKFRVASFGPAQVVLVRHVGPYSEVDGTWDKLFRLAERLEFAEGVQKTIGIVYDNPLTTDQDKIRYDACIAVADADVARLDLESLLRPEQEARIDKLQHETSWEARHKGSYASVREVYSRALEGNAFARYEFAGPSAQPPYYEVYLNDPRRTPAEGLVTDVYIPAR